MQAIVLSVGDELLGGASVDTNSAYVSRRLGEFGLAVLRHVTVGDDAGRISKAISAAVAEAELVVITGGLGPTPDDLTRRALACAMGVELVEDARSLDLIRGFFVQIGREMEASNRLQALIPAGADALDNDAGTAPGISARLGKAAVFALPGPPDEMAAMFERHVVARLPAAGSIVRVDLHTFGAGESDIGQRIADLMERHADPRVGTTVKEAIVSVRIAASGGTAEQARAAAERSAAEIRRRLGGLVFGQDGQTLPGVVGSALKSAAGTLAVAESCTGGMIGKMMTDTAGASEYFLGGVVSYSNAAKTDLLGVAPEIIETHGAVSGPVAAAMARGARRRFAADFGLGATGIAGPAGGSAEKPVGLVYLALAGPDRTDVHRHKFIGTRDAIRLRAALTAINHLRLTLP